MQPYVHEPHGIICLWQAVISSGPIGQFRSTSNKIKQLSVFPKLDCVNTWGLDSCLYSQGMARFVLQFFPSLRRNWHLKFWWEKVCSVQKAFWNSRKHSKFSSRPSLLEGKLWETNLFSWVWGSFFLLALRLLHCSQICFKFPFQSLAPESPIPACERRLSYYANRNRLLKLLSCSFARRCGGSAKYPLAQSAA